MKIQSRFKDYYDYVAHVYGGGDPLHVYVREPIAEEHQWISVPGSMTMPSLRYLNYNTGVQHKHLCIAGKTYLLKSERDEKTQLVKPYQLFTEKNFPKDYEQLSKRRFWWSNTTSPVDESNYIGKSYPVVDFIAKAINQPVFMIAHISPERHSYRVYLDRNIPTLADYDIPGIIPAEQLYQELSYYYINAMKDSPDTMPASQSTDKEKVLQHGFDAKQSFRHRK